MNRRQSLRAVAAAVLGAALLAAIGCETDERRDALSFGAMLAAGEEVGDTELFHVEVELYRRYTGSKWLLDKDHVFTVKDESHVKAEVTFHNMRPQRPYSVHLVWIRPDGRELFRRYAEVTRQEVSLPERVVPDSTGALPGFFVEQLARRFGAKNAERIARRLGEDPGAAVPVNVTVYKKAVDLDFADDRIEVGAGPDFNLDSRLNISREKQRDPGDYRLRVYLDRRLLLEIPFTVQEKT